jgi:hypothetical protein
MRYGHIHCFPGILHCHNDPTIRPNAINTEATGPLNSLASGLLIRSRVFASASQTGLRFDPSDGSAALALSH